VDVRSWASRSQWPDLISEHLVCTQAQSNNCLWLLDTVIIVVTSPVQSCRKRPLRLHSILHTEYLFDLLFACLIAIIQLKSFCVCSILQAEYSFNLQLRSVLKAQYSFNLIFACLIAIIRLKSFCILIGQSCPFDPVWFFFIVNQSRWPESSIQSQKQQFLWSAAYSFEHSHYPVRSHSSHFYYKRLVTLFLFFSPLTSVVWYANPSVESFLLDFLIIVAVTVLPTAALVCCTFSFHHCRPDLLKYQTRYYTKLYVGPYTIP